MEQNGLLANAPLPPDLQKELVNYMARDPQSAIADFANDHLKQEFNKFNEQRKSKKTVNVSVYLTRDQQTQLERWMPIYNYNFTGTSHSKHAMSNAARTIMQHYIVGKFNKTERFLDVGSNYVTLFKAGIYNVHCCCPLIDHRDSKRATERTYQFRKYISELSPDSEQMRQYKLFEDQKDFRICNRKAQECDVPAKAAMFLDSAYDIDLMDMAYIMDAHGCELAYGNFFFSPTMLLADQGLIPQFDIEWVIREESVELEIANTTTYDLKQKYVYYYFKGDSEMGYRHKLDNLVRLATQQSITTDRSQYLLEREDLDGMLVFSLVKVAKPMNLSSQLNFRLWDHSLKDKKFVRVFDYNFNTKSDFNDKLKQQVVCISADMFNRLYSYALRITEENKDSAKDIFSYASSLNTRFTANGVEITPGDRMPAEELYRLAYSMFFLTFCERAKQKLISRNMISKELIKRRLSQAGLMELLKIYLTDGKVDGINVEDLHLPSKGWFRGFKEKARNVLYDIILTNDQTPGIEERPVFFEYNEFVYNLENEFQPASPSYGRLQPLHDALKFMLIPSALEQLADKLSTACRMTDPATKEFGKLVDLRNLTLRQLAKVDPNRARTAAACWSPKENCERILDTILPLKGSDLLLNDGLKHHEKSDNKGVLVTSRPLKSPESLPPSTPRSDAGDTVGTASSGRRPLKGRWWFDLTIECNKDAPGVDDLRELIANKLAVINVSGEGNLCGARALAKSMPKDLNISVSVVKVQLASLADGAGDSRGFSKSNFSLEQLRYYANRISVAVHVIYVPVRSGAGKTKAFFDSDPVRNAKHSAYLLNECGEHWLGIVSSNTHEGADWKLEYVDNTSSGTIVNAVIDPDPDLSNVNSEDDSLAINFDDIDDSNGMFVGKFECVEDKSDPGTEKSSDTIRGGARSKQCLKYASETDESSLETDSSLEYCKWRLRNPEPGGLKKRRSTCSAKAFKNFVDKEIVIEKSSQSPNSIYIKNSNGTNNKINPLTLMGGRRHSSDRFKRAFSDASQPTVVAENVSANESPEKHSNKNFILSHSSIIIKNFKNNIKNFISKNQYKKFKNLIKNLLNISGYISTTILISRLLHSNLLNVILSDIFSGVGELGLWFLGLPLSYKLAVLFSFLYLLGTVGEPYGPLIRAGYLPAGLYSGSYTSNIFRFIGVKSDSVVGNFGVTDAVYGVVRGLEMLMKCVAVPFVLPLHLLRSARKQFAVARMVTEEEVRVTACHSNVSALRPQLVSNLSTRVDDPYCEGFCSTQTYVNGFLGNPDEDEKCSVQEALLDAVVGKLPAEGPGIQRTVKSRVNQPEGAQEQGAHGQLPVNLDTVRIRHTKLLMNYYKYVDTELRELENHCYAVYMDLKKFDGVTVENLRDKRFPATKAVLCKRLAARTYRVPQGLDIETLDCVFDPYVPTSTTAVEDIVDIRRSKGALISVCHKPGSNTFMTDFDSPEVLVTEHIASSLVHKTKRSLARNKISSVDPNRKFELVDGVPGCGKTMAAIEDMDGNTLLAIETKIACQDAKRKANSKNKPVENIRTAGSCIINGSKKFPKLIVDEGLMMHPGAIIYLSELVGATNIKVYGDRQQIAFIPRVGDRNRTFKLPDEDGVPITINWGVSYRTLSHRVPMDVAVILRRYYKNGFWTTNCIEKSLSKKVIANVAQVPKEHNWQYICFTRAQAEKLRNMGYSNACTIGESEGSTFKNVRMVRGENILDAGLRREMSQAIVALSRHTNNFEYWTIDQSKDKDLVFELVEEARKLENVARAHGDFKSSNNNH
jgi:hypothetical protein